MRRSLAGQHSRPTIGWEGPVRTDGGTGKHGGHENVVTGTVDKGDVSERVSPVDDLIAAAYRIAVIDLTASRLRAHSPQQLHPSITSWPLTLRVRFLAARVTLVARRRRASGVLAFVDLPGVSEQDLAYKTSLHK